MSGTALFLSPHLDDAAFSCGGTLARLAREGWRTVLLTVFTRSVPDPEGFALACQLDKGLPPEADYLSLRREEDKTFARKVGAAEVVHLEYAEAPHRGYASAAELFSRVRPGDEIWKPLSEDLAGTFTRLQPEVVFAPQGLGGHVDHLQAIRALLAAFEKTSFSGGVLCYRDVPYAVREPQAEFCELLLPAGKGEFASDVTPDIETKLDAASAYATQLGFQFGGEDRMREELRLFAQSEARRLGRPGAAEAFLVRDRIAVPGAVFSS